VNGSTCDGAGRRGEGSYVLKRLGCKAGRTTSDKGGTSKWKVSTTVGAVAKYPPRKRRAAANAALLPKTGVAKVRTLGRSIPTASTSSLRLTGLAVYDAPMSKTDEQLIEAILGIVDQAQRRAAGRRQSTKDSAGPKAAPHYRLYWLALSDLGAKEGCVEYECPSNGRSVLVPAFVQKFFAGAPDPSHFEPVTIEDVYESFGYLAFPNEAGLYSAYGKLVAEVQAELRQPDASFQYVEIKARLCDPLESCPAADKGLTERMYGVQLWAGVSVRAETGKPV